MNGEQKRLARDAIGLPNKPGLSSRNHAVVRQTDIAHPLWMAMTAAGLARRCENAKHCDGADLFWLTRAGADLAILPGERLDCRQFLPIGAH